MYREFLPHPALSLYVDRFWSSQVHLGTSALRSEPAQRVLPDGCIDVILDLRAATTSVVGTMSRALVLEPRPVVTFAAVRFRPGGAAPFLGLPADLLTDRSWEPGALGLTWLLDVAQAAASRPETALRSLEQLLLSRLSLLRPPDPMARHLAHAMFASAQPSLHELAADTGFSRQHLGRVCQREIGVSPKRLARVGRMQRALVTLRRGSERGLAQLALECGYFDQAHMALDFRELIGLSPTQVRAASDSIFPIPSLLTEASSPA